MDKSSHWPLGIAIIYISFVVILIAFVIFSTYHKVDLVTMDYYEQEIKYQQQIDRINRADSLSTPVTWHHDKGQRLVTIQFPMELKAIDVEGNILFFRPSDAKQDKLMALRLSLKNIQTISTQHLIPGLWKLKIFWQIDEKDFYTEGILVI
jgi:hypothetical protein